MTDDEVFAAIADERRGLAAELSALSPDDWRTPSLCDDWTVHDVAAHLVMPLVTPTWRFVVQMARTRGDFDRANIALTGRVARQYPDSLPEMLTRCADTRFTPPGLGPLAPLTDVLVHGQDIRRPLGLPHTPDATRQATVLDFLVGDASQRRPRTFRAPETVRWRATDIDWASPGSGPEVVGPAEAIMLVLTGRDVALADLSGPGVDELRGGP
ncbi:maleylpyruvate isomerase family mycothiol-dependent enzyme [Gordonia sinesedis]